MPSPMKDYLAIRALSSGLVHTLLTQSPYHAHWQFEHPEDESSTAADIGTAIHSALLEGLDVVEKIIPEMYPAKNGKIPEGWTNPAIKEARDVARAAGKVPLLPDDADHVTDAVIAIRGQLARTELAGVFESGEPELTVRWAEDPNGVSCKLRADWLNDRFHVSLKTTDGSGRPDSFIRRCLGPLGYDTSLAFYERGLRTTGWQGESRILVAEQNPPFRISVIGLSPARQAYCETRVQRAIEAWQRGMATGRWPAYPTQTAFAELMPWEDAAEAEIMFTDEQLKEGIPL